MPQRATRPTIAPQVRCSVSGGGRILVVDDVWTTGQSMRQFIGENVHYHDGDHILRAVVFARTPTPSDVTALFTLYPGDR